MAPKRRTAKPRLTRMDAAIDAMNQFGFPKSLVRRTVKGLLKEYGGDEGWAFIEGDAYKLLIETILDEQEKRVEEERELKEGRQDQCEEKGKNLLKDSSHEGRAKDNAVATGAGSSKEVLALACSEDSLRERRSRDEAVVTGARPSGGVRALACSEHTASENILAEVQDHTSRTGADGEDWKKICLNQNCSQNVVVANMNSVAGTSLDSTQSTASSVVSPLSSFSNLPTRRRKPCYGWISDDDEDGDEDDFIELPPDIQSAKSTMVARTHIGWSDGTDKRAKRKMLW